jgi:carbamoyltransferase
LRESPFEDIWIQPASGDAAGALGAALLVWYQYLSNLRNADPVMDSMSGSLLGPAYSDAEIEDSLKKNNAVYENLNQSDLPDIVAGLIEKQNVIGWFQGRLEFGPRALGSRSIIADPRNINMQSRMNSNIKSRESFRPLAPAVLEEFASDWFELDRPSPYMLITAKVKNDKRLPIEDKPDIAERLKIKRSLIPAVTHVDYSSRVQTVNKEFNRLYYEMIRAFYKITGCPAVINTSFNLKEEPIVCTPDDALRCFMRTDLDYLIIGNFLLDKKKQKMPKRREVRFRYRRPAVENAVILLNYLITAITNLLARFMHPDKINLDMATAQSYWLRYQGQIFKAQGAVR